MDIDREQYEEDAMLEYRNTRGITLSPLSRLHVGKHQLEPIAQRPHVWVRVTLQLVALGNHFNRPAVQPRVLARLETEVEVARMLRVDAEGVGRSPGVGLGVCLQPCVYYSR